LLSALSKKTGYKEFTIVADAAMITADNIKELTQNNINYIIGARLGNISVELLETINENIIREDGKSIRLKTELGYLICSYSSFRISKSDLQARPVFHFKKEPIQLHLLICFMALVVSKLIELKTGLSIRRFIDESKKVVDGQILNHLTNKLVLVNAEPADKMKRIISKLFTQH
jgi:transposase